MLCLVTIIGQVKHIRVCDLSAELMVNRKSAGELRLSPGAHAGGSRRSENYLRNLADVNCGGVGDRAIPKSEKI